MPPKGTKRKVGTESGTTTPQQPTLAESLSYNHFYRPFKNSAYTKNVNRRSKNLKALLTQEREREKVERERRRAQRGFTIKEEGAETGDAMDVDGEVGAGRGLETKEGKGADLSWMGDQDIPTYHSIEAPPSFTPLRHYCDITGLEAPYTDPTSGLRYHDKSIYELVRGLNTGAAKEYLMARGVNPIVK